LGFSGNCSNRLFAWRALSASVSVRNLTSNGSRGSSIMHHARNSLSKFHSTRINRLQASQIAAALLFDLGTVDIRRVGTRQSEYSSRGVPSKAKSGRRAFAGIDESRPSLGRTA
jgi:hypothetical protein